VLSVAGLPPPHNAAPDREARIERGEQTAAWRERALNKVRETPARWARPRTVIRVLSRRILRRTYWTSRTSWHLQADCVARYDAVEGWLRNCMGPPVI
jgi:hypothetical protein